MDLPDAYQSELPIIHHKVESASIDQRATDGYINATEMCKVAERPWNRYWDTGPTQRFMEALSSETGIPVSELAQRVRGGPPHLQGTWVHPQVALHLAQWLSPEFAVRVTKWVFEWISGQGGGQLPDHVRRYIVNRHKIPNTHFSMLDQMTLRLLAPLEVHGYLLPRTLFEFFNIFRIKRAILAYYMVGRLKNINLNEERNIEMATKTPKIKIIASANGVFAYMVMKKGEFEMNRFDPALEWMTPEQLDKVNDLYLAILMEWMNLVGFELAQREITRINSFFDALLGLDNGRIFKEEELDQYADLRDQIEAFRAGKLTISEAQNV